MVGVPEPWATRMAQRGLSSYTRLADASGVAVETVRRAVLGVGVPRPETVRALSVALGDDIQGWIGVHLGDRYSPPSDADLLDPDERAAVDQMIRLLARGKRQDSVARSVHLGRSSGDSAAASDSTSSVVASAADATEDAKGLDQVRGQRLRTLPSGPEKAAALDGYTDQTPATREELALLAEKRAARRGRSRGVTQREDDDARAHAPDEPGPESGA